MHSTSQLEGELLARQVADRAKAEAVLAEQHGPLARFQYFMWLLLGLAWGWSMSAWSSRGTSLIGAVAGAAFLLAAAAFRECIQLRRKLDAVGVLLRTSSDL